MSTMNHLLLLMILSTMVTACLSSALLERAGENCKRTASGIDYMGSTSVTRKGYNCQAWNSNEPNQNEYQEDWFYPDGSKDAAKNYCRNPNRSKFALWCYIDDERTTDTWDYCDICFCEDKDEKTKGCYIQDNAEDYTGTMNISFGGAYCLPWSSQDVDFPCLENAENYCRNPDGSDKAWCFTQYGRIECHVCHCDDWEHDVCEKKPCDPGYSCYAYCGGRISCTSIE